MIIEGDGKWTPEQVAWQQERWQMLESWKNEATANLTEMDRLESIARLMEAARHFSNDAQRHEYEEHNRGLWREYRERCNEKIKSPR